MESTGVDRNLHQQLINRCRQGDTSALEEIYRLYSKAMYNTSLRILGTTADAEDATQEAFIKAFQKIETFVENSSFGAWLKRIVINTSLDMLRKRNRGPLLSEEVLSFQAADDPREEVEREAEIALNYDKVIKAISSLPEGYKLVVNLYLVEGLDHKEVGEILGISESTSRSQLARAKKRLLEILQKGH
ncbi:MAG TPA: RNA polymerase sigma factor [Williamwhitmania sp.]|jgi:RNA polymerase sigma-70 factor (ECF subfamily)|nr:RNA polymerase sigma factor [Williamwhitmania sp.]